MEKLLRYIDLLSSRKNTISNRIKLLFLYFIIIVVILLIVFTIPYWLLPALIIDTTRWILVGKTFLWNNK